MPKIKGLSIGADRSLQNHTPGSTAVGQLHGVSEQGSRQAAAPVFWRRGHSVYACHARCMDRQRHRRADVQVRDAFGNAATVRLDLHRWVEFLQMARWNGAWKIVNVLWYPRE